MQFPPARKLYSLPFAGELETNMRTPIFTGAGVAIVTPFTADGKVNYPKLGEIIEAQIAGHTDAIIICGTTGEACTLTDEEHKECIRYTVEKVAGRIPVIAGTGSNDTDYAIQLSVYAAEVGADGLLLVTPYYNKATQKGLVMHFNAIANAAKIPCIIYNVPSRTGVNIAPETYLEMSKNPYIVACKEASGNISAVAKTASLCGDDFAIYSGNDDQITAILSLGGKGVISVLSNVCPKETHDICQSYFDGDVETSRKLQLKYIALCDALFCEVNPIPVKTAMNMMGMEVGGLRLPLCEMSEQNAEKLRKTLKDYDLI